MAHQTSSTAWGLDSRDGTSWVDQARCRDVDPDALFVQGAEQNAAKRICDPCPVRLECLAEALQHRLEWGVWGGLTERERRLLLGRNPQVRDWEVWLRDREARQGQRRRERGVCGTADGYQRHLMARVPVCDPCWAAHKLAMLEDRKARR
jgi:WhiB family redox-sensing transcriptional regulator